MAFDEKETGLLPCPKCGEPTDSLKEYRYVRWCVFLLGGAVYQDATVGACPRCMRAFLRKSLLINVLPANVVWLVGLLPWGLVLLAATYRKGHSRSIRQALALAEARKGKTVSYGAVSSAFVAQEVVTASGQEVSWTEVTAVVAVLTCWLPYIGLLFGLWAFLLNRHEPGWKRVCSIVALSVSGLLSLAVLLVLCFS
jgi:hypothetical protein